MSAHEEKNDELDPLEAQLAALRPRFGRLDRDKLMFLAGRASAGRAAASGTLSIRFWRVLAGAMTAVSAALLAMLICRPAPPAGVPASTGIAQAPGSTSHGTTGDSPVFAATTLRAVPEIGTVPGLTPPESAPLPPDDNLCSTAVFGGLPLAWYAPPVLGPHSSAFLRLRAAALAGGLDGPGAMELGGSPSGAQGTPPVSNRQLLDSLLNEPARGWPSHRSSMDLRFQGAHT